MGSPFFRISPFGAVFAKRRNLKSFVISPWRKPRSLISHLSDPTVSLSTVKKSFALVALRDLQIFGSCLLEPVQFGPAVA